MSSLYKCFSWLDNVGGNIRRFDLASKSADPRTPWLFSLQWPGSSRHLRYGWHPLLNPISFPKHEQTMLNPSLTGMVKFGSGNQPRRSCHRGHSDRVSQGYDGLWNCIAGLVIWAHNKWRQETMLKKKFWELAWRCRNIHLILLAAENSPLSCAH
jgi:hypothetical protein